MDARRTVVIGFYGTTLDSATGAGRWKRWRPTFSLTQHEDLLIDRFELLCPESARPDVLIRDMARASPETEVRRHPFPSPDPWDFEDVYARLHDFVKGYDFDLSAERYLVHLTTGTHVAQICMFLLTESGFFPAALLQSAPPRMGSPEPTYQIIDLDLSRYDQIAERFEADRQQRTHALRAGIASKNLRFTRIIDEIEEVARSSTAPILLSGPTGTGKTQLARRIFASKQAATRVTGEFIETNCATLRGDQAMSALFGHKRGAFTGATSDRQGLLALADQGVVFLDEVGELGLDEQAMLLSAIEDKRFTPLGGERSVSSDFQLIAGTNRDLRAAVRRGEFREDLLARIDLWHYELPSLAERPEDIAPNIDFELDRAGGDLRRRVVFSAEARVRFLRFAQSERATWDGNFRDLSASVTRLATLATGGRIKVHHVDAEIVRLEGRWHQGAAGAAGTSRVPGANLLRDVLDREALEALDRFDRMQLEGVLEVCGQSESLADAGRRLFDQSRTRKKTCNDADRIRKYLARFGIEGTAVVGRGRG